MMIFHIQRCKPFQFLVISFILFSIAGLSLTQGASNARILRAIAYSDGRLLIHAEIPDGQTLSQAELRLSDSEAVSLNIDSDALSVDNWLILDGGAGAIEVGRVFQSALEPLGAIVSANHALHLMIVDDEVRQFSNIANSEDLKEKLGNYNPQINASTCFSDALDTLPDADVTRARRVLLLAGETTENCNADINLTTPVDIIQISNNRNNFSDLADGLYFQASVQSISSHIHTMQSRWQNPVYLIQGEIDTHINDGTVAITLSSGEVVHLEAEFEQIIVPTPIPTATEISGITAVSTPTDIPTSEATEQVVVPDTESAPTEIVITEIPRLLFQMKQMKLHSPIMPCY